MMMMLGQHAHGDDDRLDLDVPLDDFGREIPAAIALLRGPNLTYAHANRAYCRLVGHDSLTGVSNHDLHSCFVTAAVARVFATGTAFIDHELSIVLDREGNGHLSRGILSTSRSSRWSEPAA